MFRHVSGSHLRNVYHTPVDEKTPDGSIKVVHHTNEVWIRKTFSASEPWVKVQYLRRENPMDNVMTTTPSQLYDGPLPLKPAKVADLKKRAAQHLATIHQSFYMNLRAEGEDSDTKYTNSDFSEDPGLFMTFKVSTWPTGFL